MEKFKTGQKVTLDKEVVLISFLHLVGKELTVVKYIATGLISQPFYVVVEFNGEEIEINPVYLNKMEEFDQTKAKEPNRYEIIGMQNEATKVINQMFGLELPFLNACYSQKKFFVDNLDTYNDEYGLLKSYFLNEANDLIFTFEEYNTENDLGSFYLDLSIWNGSNSNPLKKIK